MLIEVIGVLEEHLTAYISLVSIFFSFQHLRSQPDWISNLGSNQRPSHIV